MAENLTKDSEIEIVAQIKDKTFDFITTASKIKSVVEHFLENPSSLKDKFQDLSKKMDAFKNDDDEAIEKMTDHELRVMMDCVIHWIFAYKFLLPEDIKLIITKKDAEKMYK
jgi:uncharacterized membrane protein YheB (UPF0754 family)